MIRHLLGLLALFFCASAWAQSPPSANTISGVTNGKPPAASVGAEGNYFLDYQTGLVFGPKTSNQWPTGASTGLAPHISTNAALIATTTAAYPSGVWRDDYSAGLGAPPLWFLPESGTCAANSRVSDGGSCQNTPDGNSFYAVYSGPADVREWGAQGVGSSHDDSGAIQAAENAIESTKLSYGLAFQCRQYGVANTIVASPSYAFGLKWRGCGGGSTAALNPGTQFVGMASFSGTAVVQIAGAAANSSTSAGFDLSGFSIVPQTVGSGPTTGLLVGGSSTYRLQGGQHQAVISDVHVENFAQNLSISNARLIDFERVSSNETSTTGAAYALYISNLAGTNFTGDLEFNHCQFVGQASGSYSAYLISNQTPSGGGSNGQLSGVKFHSTTFYYNPVYILASAANAGISDLWFDGGTQFDSVAGTGWSLNANASGSFVVDTHIDSVYATTTVNTTFVSASTSNGGTVQEVMVHGGMFQGSTSGSNPLIQATGATAVSVIGLEMRDNAGTNGLINLFNCSGCTVMGVNAHNLFSSGNFDYLAKLTGNSDYGVIIGNTSNGLNTGATGANGNIQNLASGTHNTVTGNF